MHVCVRHICSAWLQDELDANTKVLEAACERSENAHAALMQEEQAHASTHADLEALRTAYAEMADTEALVRQQLRALHAQRELDRTREEAA